MKNVRKLSLALAALFLLTATSFAYTGGEGELITVKETSNLKFQINKVTNSQKVAFGLMLANNENVRLTITDETNKAVYQSWHRNSNGFMRTFDFSTVEDGVYTFEVKAGNEKVMDKVVLKESKAILPEFTAYISDVEDQKVKFSYFAPDKDVYLVLKGENGNTLYQKKVGSGYNASGIANLSKLTKGTYTLQIKNGNRVESKQIKI